MQRFNYLTVTRKATSVWLNKFAYLLPLQKDMAAIRKLGISFKKEHINKEDYPVQGGVYAFVTGSWFLTWARRCSLEPRII